MSGVLKKIGKVFRKVTKVIKKVALPALAIGAVVLTGGAALGVMPALSTSLGSLGLSQGLTAALATAAKGATMGFVTSAVTGGNPLKGATTGFITGGLLGAAGQVLRPAAAAAGSAASGAGATAAGTVADTAATLPGTGATISLPGVAEGAAQIAGAAAPAASAAATTATAGGGGLLSFLNQNPVLAGQVLQGVGNGLMASSQASEERKMLKRLGANYEGFSGLNDNPVADPTAATNIGKVQFDPKTGRIVQVAG